MNQNIVDVLLPVFNGATTISEAIESLQRQTFTSFRVIVVDDGRAGYTARMHAIFAQRSVEILHRYAFLQTPT